MPQDKQILPRRQSSERLTSNVLADKAYFCPPSIVMNATFCSHRDWEYPDTGECPLHTEVQGATPALSPLASSHLPVKPS